MQSSDSEDQRESAKGEHRRRGDEPSCRSLLAPWRGSFSSFLFVSSAESDVIRPNLAQQIALAGRFQRLVTIMHVTLSDGEVIKVMSSSMQSSRMFER